MRIVVRPEHQRGSCVAEYVERHLEEPFGDTPGLS
jgi:hypothetical protein